MHHFINTFEFPRFGFHLNLNILNWEIGIKNPVSISKILQDMKIWKQEMHLKK